MQVWSSLLYTGNIIGLPNRALRHGDWGVGIPNPCLRSAARLDVDLNSRTSWDRWNQRGVALANNAPPVRPRIEMIDYLADRRSTLPFGMRFLPGFPSR